MNPRRTNNEVHRLGHRTPDTGHRTPGTGHSPHPIFPQPGAPINCVCRTPRSCSTPAGYLELIAGREMSLEEKQAFIAETVDSYERYYNRGFITYRKSVTQAGQFAALEWSGEGSMLHDLLGREYIDCLGGYGIFSAGVNHPKIVKAVTDQLERMALNSQELLEPWRAALAKVLAEITPGDLQNSFFINNGTDAIEGAIKLARLYTKRNTFISTHRRVPRQVAWARSR